MILFFSQSQAVRLTVAQRALILLSLVEYSDCACAGGLRYLSCLSVCLSVTTLAATSFVLTLKVRYVGVYYRLFLDFNSWIFDKTFRSKVMAWKSQLLMSIYLPRPPMALMQRHFTRQGLLWFFQSLTLGYK